MAEVVAAEERPVQVKKDLYEIGEIPPMGHVPRQMYAWVIRRDREGEPEQAMQVEVVDENPRKGPERPGVSVRYPDLRP